MANPKNQPAGEDLAKSESPPKPNTMAAAGGEDDERESPPKPSDPKAAAAADAAASKSAFIVDNGERFIARPPPGVPLHTLGYVVLGNWVGRLGSKSVNLRHGTPIKGLPPEIVEKLRTTRDVQVGKVPTPAEKQAAANGG